MTDQQTATWRVRPASSQGMTRPVYKPLTFTQLAAPIGSNQACRPASVTPPDATPTPGACTNRTRGHPTRHSPPRSTI